MKIWLPDLHRVYATTFDGKNVFVRFTAYGVSHSTSDRPIDLTFSLYRDNECKDVIKYDDLGFAARWEKQKQIYDCEFIDTGVVIEKLGKPKKIPTTIEELLHALSLKSNQRSRMDVSIKFRDGLIVPQWFYSFNRLVKKNEDGTYQYHRPGRTPSVGIESFTAEDVVELSCNVLGKYFYYANGILTSK